jgi:pimeloyl-ACP methyl ester carboxylesterase
LKPPPIQLSSSLTVSKHVPAHFNKVTKLLEAAGYTCVGVELPGNTTNPHIDDRLIGIQDDFDMVRKTVLAQLEAGQDVVVITHSYGCIPGLAALEGFDFATRKSEGQKSSVKAVVMIAGFLCPPGGTMIDAMGGQLLPVYLHENDATLPFNGSGAIHVLYNDLEINEALKAVWRLKPQSYGINTSIIPDQLAGLKGIPLNFLLCRNDNATPWEAQTASVEGFKGAGVEVYAEVAESGHSPFLKFPDETASFVRRAAAEKIETGFVSY